MFDNDTASLCTGIAGSIGAIAAYALTPFTGSAVVTLAVAGAVGAAVYVAVARLVRLGEMRQLVTIALPSFFAGRA